MAADDQPVSDPEQGIALRDLLRSRCRSYWDRVRDIDWLPRLALHLCFLAAASAGLLLATLVSTPRFASPVLVSASRQEVPDVRPQSPPEGGIGGEQADLLLCNVVPHTTIPRRYRIDPITYTVQAGDNVSTIAQQFAVSVETILWNNGNLEDNPDYLSYGDVLTILPVSGVYHTVAEGDSLDGIAEQYKVQSEDITGYEGNHMEDSDTIAVGQKLIVPGGSKPYKIRHVVAWSGPIPENAKRGTGLFGYPMSGWISQRYHEYHRALDIAGPEGRLITAADSGYVAVVGRSDRGYGRYVLIDHGNGFQTLYAHFGVIFVKVGQSVGKGQTIGLCGSTGKSTGPHVHFEVILNGVKRNPSIYLP